MPHSDLVSMVSVYTIPLGNDEINEIISRVNLYKNLGSITWYSRTMANARTWIHHIIDDVYDV